MNGAYKPMPLVLKDPPKAAYSPLPMYKGCGSVHMNRFRICVRVPTNRGSVAHIGAHLAANMPQYMPPGLAAVRLGDGPWNGRNTLKFRAVMRIRPFAVPVPKFPAFFIPVPVPQRLRDWMAPDIHTDSVGIIQSSANGFTVQTLKREYEDEDDKAIRAPLHAAGAPDAVADFAININQHHFLAGRRSFRFDSGRNFGYDDDRLVFETAAIERYSHPVFEYSQIAVGNIPAIVRQIWCQMAHRFCETHGLEKIVNEPAQPGWSKSDPATHSMQTEVAPNAGAIRSAAQFPAISKLHPQLMEDWPARG